MRHKLFIGITFNIALLGVVSLLTDVSSELIMPLLPLFLITLGATPLIIGLIEGVSDCTSSILKVFSGYCSDRIGKRKCFVSAGYITSALAKIFLPFSFMWHHVLSIRFFDRIGKGVRTAPRDAMISESAFEERKGKAFGFHRACDTSGAILGSLLAILLFPLISYRGIFLIAIIPACSAAILTLLVKEKIAKSAVKKLNFSSLPKEFKIFIVITALFSLGNFSYAFMLLRAKMFTESITCILLLYLLFNILYTLLAVPSGVLSDKIGRPKVLTLGYGITSLMFLGFAFTNSLNICLLLFLLYGLARAINETVQRTFVADLSSKELRGSAFGIYHIIVGLAALPSSLIAGALWCYVSASAAFIFSSLLTFSALLLFMIMRKF
ncbi:MAG: MFS transporter [Candidatus Thermoplasmatota archaeon]|nr:MFS transporter [Candidatus Thermoplasmatota archaeon]